MSFLCEDICPCIRFQLTEDHKNERDPAGDNFTHVRLYLKASAENRENMLAFFILKE